MRLRLAGPRARALYDDKVRQAVLDRILEDGMSVEGTLASMRQDFHLDLSDGFVDDCLDREVKRLDMVGHRRSVRERFSSTLCIDSCPSAARRCCLEVVATDGSNFYPAILAEW